VSLNRDLARRVLDAALSAGADQADLRFEQGISSTTQLRMGELEVLKESAGLNLNLRVFSGRRKAMLSSTESDPETLCTLAAEAVDLAARCAVDEFNLLPEPELYAGELPELDLDDPAPPPKAAERIEIARAVEAAALDADPRIDNSQGAAYQASAIESGYFTSNGFESLRRSSRHAIWVRPVAREVDGGRVTDIWSSRSRHFRDLDAPALVGAEAARRTLRKLEAREAPTGRFPVIFDAPMAARLMRMLFSCLSGDAVRRGQSYLAGRLGESIAASSLTLVDDPHRLRGPGSRPCDGEGLPGARRNFVEAGRLLAYATDLESARRLKLPPTGHGLWGGGVGSSNLHCQPGDRSPEAIIADTPRGLLLTDMMGGGFRVASGHWSQGCTGLWIEGGEIAYPVREATIAGDFEDLLMGIDAIGDDLDFGRGAVAAPTLRVAEMALAGAGGEES
jgi:PmbA protein